MFSHFVLLNLFPTDGLELLAAFRSRTRFGTGIYRTENLSSRVASGKLVIARSTRSVTEVWGGRYKVGEEDFRTGTRRLEASPAEFEDLRRCQDQERFRSLSLHLVDIFFLFQFS